MFTQKLTACQLLLIDTLGKSNEFTASALAREFCYRLSIAESTYWHNLRGLKKKELLSFGNAQAVSLTTKGNDVAVRLHKEVEIDANEGTILIPVSNGKEGGKIKSV